MTEPQHRRAGVFTPRRLAAGGVVLLAAVLGSALLLQNGGSACAAPPTGSAAKGKASFYDLNGGQGNCSFPGSPADDLFVALGPEQYSAGAACGMYLDVTGPKGKVRVKVTDQCPECAPGHLDLSRTAFKKIGAEVDGIIPITYRSVANPSTGALSVRIKEGSSRFWFAALIDNHGTQLRSVQVAGPGGSFKATKRESFNYWILDGGAGPGPYRLKITDAAGRATTVSGITMTPGKTQKPSSRTSAGSAPAKTTAPAKPAPKATTSPPAAKPSRTPSLAPTAASPAAATATAAVPGPPADVVAANAPEPAPVDLAAGAASCD